MHVSQACQPLLSCVRVHSRQEEIDTKVSHEHSEKCQDAKAVEAFCAAQPGKRMAVEADGIDHEGNQGPCLFRVPTPVGTPRLVGPHGAQENADAEEEDSRVEEQASESMSGSACREMHSPRMPVSMVKASKA